MSILAEICEKKREHVSARKSVTSHATLKSMLADASAPRGFISALKAAHAAGRYGLICEIKKASPSKGLIRADFDPASLAKAYQNGGATCLSVLTDEPYFQGADAYLKAARDSVTLPCLRKDFMVDPYQIDESRVLGADCILLILSALSDNEAADLEGHAHDLGMDVLIEVHDEEEMERALRLQSPLVGVNNRNLKTMEQTIDISKELSKLYSSNHIAVSESSLGSPEDLLDLESYGYRTFLIGETFMRQDDVAAAVKSFQRG